MNARPAPRSVLSRGFSIVELLVAIAIGSVLTLLIATVFERSSKTGTVTESVNEIQEQARIAIDMLQRDLRQAGYSGCNSNRLLGSGGLVNTIASPNAYLNDIAAFLRGHEGTGGSFLPGVPAELSGATPAADPTGDAVTMRIPVGEPVGVSGTMASASAAVPVHSTAGFGTTTRVLISDCAQSSAFRVTSITAGQLNHVAGASNATANLGRAYGTDATVVPFATVSYYLGASSVAPTGTELSLWRREGVNAPEEVAEGVEGFELLYGLDTNGDLAADLFDTADNVADWNQVVAVRASLLLRSKSATVAQVAQNFTFNGETDIAPDDQRLRRPFNVTIQLRNRTL